jgi:tRNA pseudouridine38-40 synthase
MAWHRKEFDLKAMREGAQYLIGRHDFKAFAAAKRSSKTTVRSIQSIHIQPMRGGTAFHFRGGGFLYRQVRNMVGSLWDVGMHKHAPIWLHHVLQSGDRKKAGPTAPAEGLYLWRVFYASDPFVDYRRSTKNRIL